jgi:signal transduction histidine kinase
VTRAAALALAAPAVAWAVTWPLLPADSATRLPLFNGLQAVAATVAAIACLLVRRRDATGELSLSLGLLGAGSLAWAFGQVLFALGAQLTSEVPTPGLSDVFFVLAGGLLAAAVLSWPRDGRRWTRSDLTEGFLFACLAFVAAFLLVVDPILDRGVDDFTGAMLLVYPIVDALLLAVVLTGLTLGRWRESGRAIVLAAALLCLISADTGFALAGDSYETGSSAVDLGWVLAFVGIGATALLPSARTNAAPRRIGSVLSLLVAVGVAAVVIENEIRTHPDGVIAIVVALSVLALLTVRSHRLGLMLEREYVVRGAALDASRTGVCMFAPAGDVLLSNRAWDHLLGPDSEHGDDWRAFVDGLVDSPDGEPVGDEPGELRFWTLGGRCLSLSASVLAGGERLVTVDDVTGQERERVARDRLLAEVVDARDVEARRIAELLHDDVVQRLTALGLRLEARALRDGDERAVELAREAGAITASIRRLLVELHPAVLESQGLGAAADSAAANLRELGVRVDVAPLETRLPPELEQLAYRLIQEAFANVLRHADASRVGVRFELTGRMLRCSVADDGRGVDRDDVQTATRRGSLGLHLVRERIELARGRFSLEPGPAGGTLFVFELPLTPVEAELAVPAAS